MPKCSHGVILGFDFLKASQAVLDCGRAELIFDELLHDEEIDSHGIKLYSMSDSVVPALEIIVFSLTFNVHLRRLHCVLSCIQEAGLVLNPRKCCFGATEIKVLGHLVSGKGVKPDPNKLEAVNSFPTPKKIHDVRSFLGLCSYYRRFIKNFCIRAKPFQQLLKGDSKFQWGKAQED
ncbi:retrovirus-related Pol polyprotein from transposon 17.6 [Trichonephila clavata]|uniref:RNA-directed DNA polymerase n=1 Tax=Trichonephila clavata TaxID=2740835 RepID=A0A8X6HZP7_TRICU|nr:retrovirus-related Pol polyprotein from transposon 17.6 [Trichonephila clavata]